MLEEKKYLDKEGLRTYTRYLTQKYNGMFAPIGGETSGGGVIFIDDYPEELPEYEIPDISMVNKLFVCTVDDSFWYVKYLQQTIQTQDTIASIDSTTFALQNRNIIIAPQQQLQVVFTSGVHPTITVVASSTSDNIADLMLESDTVGTVHTNTGVINLDSQFYADNISGMGYTATVSYYCIQNIFEWYMIDEVTSEAIISALGYTPATAQVTESTNNLFFADKVVLGKNATNTSSSTRAISAAMYVGTSNAVVYVKKLPSNLKYQIYRYADDNFTDPAAYPDGTTWFETAGTTTKIPYTPQTPRPYFRILFGSKNNATLTAADFNGLELQFETGEQYTGYLPPVTAIDSVARSYPTRLKVCTFNVGLYTLGINTPGVFPSAANISAVKPFFARENCDILGICEERPTIDSNGNTENSVIYDYLYPFIYDRGTLGGVGLKSRFPLANAALDTLPTADPTQYKTYVHATININGKKVWVACVHLGASSADREVSTPALLSILAQHDSFIVMGDFNAGNGNSLAITEYDAYLTNGYKISSGGYLGGFETCGQNYFDNIIVSPDIIIANTYVGSITGNPSDHLPLVSELVIPNVAFTTPTPTPTPTPENLFVLNDNVLYGARFRSKQSGYIIDENAGIEGQLITDYIDATVGDIIYIESDTSQFMNGYTGTVVWYESDGTILTGASQGATAVWHWDTDGGNKKGYFTIPQTNDNISLTNCAKLRLCIAYTSTSNIIINKLSSAPW